MRNGCQLCDSARKAQTEGRGEMETVEIVLKISEVAFFFLITPFMPDPFLYPTVTFL